jgi:DNA-binding HxlR family transcriptional regulator
MDTEREPKVYNCGLEAALDVVGGKWKVLIMWNLRPQPEGRRFGELKRLVTGISEKILIQQLREMQRAEVVHRNMFHEVPPRVEYSLTEFGVSLKEAMTPLCQWGEKHMQRIGAIRRGSDQKDKT